jgi:glyoxylase-like metal-dependent hydrolase (beta-lactamase superfamily II)
MNTIVVTAGRDAVVFDPSFALDEINEVQQAVSAADRLHILITHSHFDHVCGIGSFPTADVTVSTTTAKEFTSGAASRQLDAAARDWGINWPGKPRLDRVVDPDTSFTCGPFTIETIDIVGNSVDGIGYLVEDLGLFVCGDYLCTVCYPTFDASIDDSISTCERILDFLTTRRVTKVVPGHGSDLIADEAAAVGAADIAYLRTLRDRASELSASGACRGDALVELYSVEPPRPALNDLEIYCPRVSNCKVAWSTASGQNSDAPSQTTV